MHHKTILKSMALMLVGTAAIIMNPTGADAKGTLLFVAPNRVVIPDGQRATVVNVTNKDNEERQFKIVAENYIMTETGTTQLVDDFEYSAAKMIRYVPRRITLGPGERQAVRIMAKKPDGLEAGDYHTHILFEELPPEPTKVDTADSKESNKVEFQIEALYSLAIPIVVQHGALTSELKITEAELHAQKGGRYEAVVTMTRSGNSEGHGYLTIEAGPDGEQPKMVGLGGDLHIYREVDNVKRTVPLELEAGTDTTKLRAVLRKGPKPTDEIISSQPVILTSSHNVEVEN